MIYILSTIEDPTRTCHHANHSSGRSSAQPCGVEGLANYYNNDNCMTYLIYPPVFLPIVSTSTSGDAIGRWAYQAKKEEEEQINVVLFVN
jgi:hypothetical protein